MAITIPSDATKTFEKVMGALGGEDYSYYLFDVKNVNDMIKQKKYVEMVVYVPQFGRLYSIKLMAMELLLRFWQKRLN